MEGEGDISSGEYRRLVEVGMCSFELYLLRTACCVQLALMDYIGRRIHSGGVE